MGEWVMLKKFFVNGISICYESTGEGFPLIGLTGKGSNMDSWSPAIKTALSERNRLIMLDPRGTGRSDVPKETYDISDMAKDVIGLMNELDIEKAHILGQSMGGMIAQELAIENPNRVSKLILCSTTCGVKRVLPSFRMIKSLMQKNAANSPQNMINMLYSNTYIQENPQLIAALMRRMQIAPTDPRTMEIHHNASKNFDSYERLGQISAPTLIIHGEDDWVFRPKHAKVLKRRIPNSKLILFPNAGHGVFSQEHRKVLEEIHRFIDE
ncbi:alpha/beta hydrolase [Oceanobacillus piezotolerans]|uniref:Alpha/beta hydrolase n=1 Tax=Oceanobacillus piezotolerans TaxID=2448030 RepID=A0A498D6D1_9BACI|nr:alpha/beta hydrolase [Oceanobacillus piezotolerans]RLL40617.1 alpha/beta hydrolase [Oceanobacillus piezotolerans]